MAHETCPQCGASGFEWCPTHKIKIKGGWMEDMAQEVCFKCNYTSSPYSTKPINVNGRTVIVMHGNDRPVRTKDDVKQIVETEKKNERIEFKAVNGDMELTLSCGKDGLQKLLSIFMEV